MDGAIRPVYHPSLTATAAVYTGSHNKTDGRTDGWRQRMGWGCTPRRVVVAVRTYQLCHLEECNDIHLENSWQAGK